MLALPGYNINEVVYESKNSVVYRGYRETDNVPVILKTLKETYPNPHRIVRFQQQYKITQDLNVPGVIKVYALELYDDQWVMILEDFGGQSLAQLGLAGKLIVTDFIHLALKIVDSLNLIHQHNIIHKDINPANIILNPNTGEVKIIDFGISSQLSQEKPIFETPNVLEGTLPYISPEQTGRMNRIIDYRTDFYSLGVTFYELLSGQLPFSYNAPLELIHSHIARYPLPLIDIKPNMPPILGDIVLKLMAKNAEDRYQSAKGLQHDLQKCLKAAEEGILFEQSFNLGENDFSGKFAIPQKLYGREDEIEKLLTIFKKVATVANSLGFFQKHPKLVLIGGYAGVGKSSLVQELHKPITEKQGIFIGGKFNQFQKNVPHYAITSAFNSLCRQLITLPDEELQTWATRILNAIGDNGQILLEVIPDLELIIGPQPVVPTIKGTEAQNRFELVFQNFVKTISLPESPLALFIDDLQWADLASLDLIALLLQNPSIEHMLIIGAYRDNEVSASHPLMLTLNNLEKQVVKIERIQLTNLSKSDVTNLIKDTLSVEAKQISPLSALVYKKTQGNAFYTIEFLKSLYREGLLQFSVGTNTWQWDVDQIKARQISKNVVALMADKINNLPLETQEILRLAACIGSEFELGLLATIATQKEKQTLAYLWAAIKEGLIIPQDTHYKLISAANTAPQTPTSLPKARFKFVHDRVRQAAYTLIGDNKKEITHLQIGRILLTNNLTHLTTPSSGIARDTTENIFEIVNQLNAGVKLIKEAEERMNLAELNLLAGQKAIASAAYQPAYDYLQTSLTLLRSTNRDKVKTHWSYAYPFSLQVYTAMIEAAYLNDKFAEVENLTAIILRRANTILDVIEVYEIKILAYIAQAKPTEAVAVALNVLAQLGINIPPQPTAEDATAALKETETLLQDRLILNMVNFAKMVSLNKLAAMHILLQMGSAAYRVSPHLMPIVIATLINLSLKYGNTGISAYAYASYGQRLCVVEGQFDEGYQFGELALNLLERLDARELKAKIFFIIYGFITYWKAHLQKTIPPFLAGYQSGLATGDLQFAGLCLFAYSNISCWAGEELTQLESQIAAHVETTSQLKEKTALELVKIYHQTTLNLLGHSEDPRLLVGTSYDEIKRLPLLVEMKNINEMAHLYLAKLVLAYLFAEVEVSTRHKAYHQAVEIALKAAPYFQNPVGGYNYTLFLFFESLAWLAILPSHNHNLEETYQFLGEPLTQKQIIDKVDHNQQKIKDWATRAPMNYLHKYYLVEAERARVLGHEGEARVYYDQAIDLAKDNRYFHEEAIAQELAGNFYLEKSRFQIAYLYLRNAYHGYRRWGAHAKARQLTKLHQQLLIRTHIEPVSTVTTTTITSHNNNALAGLDMQSVLKAALTLSGEIVLETLLAKLMTIVIENAGAEKGFLILNKQGKWYVEAEGRINQPKVKVSQDIPIDHYETGRTYLPTSIVNYVVHTKKTVVSSEAQREEAFAQDSYIITKKPQSVLCMPLLNRGKLIGVLYLENNVIQGAFTPNRLEVLNVLSSQAAISIENAQLYQDQLELSALQRELSIAQQIQQSLLPPPKPDWEELSIICDSVPAREIGGDFYSYHCLDDKNLPTQPPTLSQGEMKRFIIAVGDVTGKGVSAALLMATSLSQFDASLMLNLSLTERLLYLDKIILAYTKSQNQNCALSYVEIALAPSTQTAQLHAVNAGGIPPYIKYANGAFEELDLGGFALGQGLSTMTGYTQATCQLNKGDLIVLSSDGVVEAKNKADEIFGFGRLKQAILNAPSTSVEALLNYLKEAVNKFTQGAELHDDTTIVVVQI